MFIEEYLKIKLKPVQRVQARIFGNFHTIYDVQSRGFGKTWITAICCIALAILYPGTNIAVISGTAEQAVLVLKKIESSFSKNPEILREIDNTRHNHPVQINAHKGICTFKNGSRIESFSLGTFRGNRAKILVIDEAPEVKQEDIEAVARPVLNTTRDICIQHSFEDFDSKLVSITSACLKNNYFYRTFTNTIAKIRTPEWDGRSIAYAMDYRAAIRAGISKQDYFEKERSDMDPTKFMMEYESIFIGNADGAVFPFDLTDKCRVLTDIEVAQPAKSTSQYVMALDIATSSASNADNAALVVIKLVELENGGYLKKLVRIRTFHGKRLDALAVEVRKALLEFPNTVKVVVDVRGLGDAFPQFMSVPWVDPVTGKEYPPLVVDTELSNIDNAVPLLHPFIATNALNQQMVSALTIALERQTIELPVSSKRIIGNTLSMVTDERDKDVDSKTLTDKEIAIFRETDALQIELGQIVGRPGANGSVLYDSAKAGQHKDRASALQMAVHYISGMEEERKQKLNNAGMYDVIGVVGFI